MTADYNAQTERLLAIIEGTRAGTWEWNVQTGENIINARWADIVGYTLEELVPANSIEHWRQLVHPEDLKLSDACFEKYFAGEVAHYDCIIRMRHKKGHWVHVHDSGKTVTWTEDGAPEWVAGTHIDITHSQKAEQFLAKLAKTIPGIIYTFNVNSAGEFSFPFVSEKSLSFVGVSADAIQQDANHIFDLVHPTDNPGLMQSIGQAVTQMTEWSYEFRLKVNGQYKWFQGSSVPEREADGSVMWYGMVTDIDRQKQLEQRLMALSSTDELTGLYNRRYLIEKLQEQLDTQQRYKTPISVVLLDIDHFKLINDMCGHHAGDRVLIAFAELLKSRLRKTDIFGRFGGEEFIIIMPHTPVLAAQELTHALLHECQQYPFSLSENKQQRVTFSAGISEMSSDDEDVSDVLTRADDAMYRAKWDGRQRVYLQETEDA